MSQDDIKNKYSIGYKPNITYVDEYDSSATLQHDNKQESVFIKKDPTTNIQDNFDRIDVFLPSLGEDIRNLIEGVYLPLKDYWEEEIEPLPYDEIPKKEEITLLPEDDDPEDDDPDDKPEYTPDDEDPPKPPPNVTDDDKIEGLIHIIKKEYPRIEIIKKEYAKNMKDLIFFYTEGLLNAISNFWVQSAPFVVGQSKDKKEYILNDIKNYNDSPTVADNKKHMLDFAVRNEIIRQQKTAFLQKMFPTDETLLKLRNFKASYELRKKYAVIEDMNKETIEASDHNALLKSTTAIYDNKYDSSYTALYKYFNSANKTLGDVMTTTVQERKAKQYLK